MAEVEVTNKKGYLAEAVIRCVLQKKCSEIFGKTYRKTSVQEPFLACRRESSFKARLLHRCFPIKFIRAAFS